MDPRAVAPPREALAPLEPQSRCGDKLLKSQVIFPQNATAILKGLTLQTLHWEEHSWKILLANDDTYTISHRSRQRAATGGGNYRESPVRCSLKLSAAARRVDAVPPPTEEKADENNRLRGLHTVRTPPLSDALLMQDGCIKTCNQIVVTNGRLCVANFSIARGHRPIGPQPRPQP